MVGMRLFLSELQFCIRAGQRLRPESLCCLLLYYLCYPDTVTLQQGLCFQWWCHRLETVERWFEAPQVTMRPDEARKNKGGLARPLSRQKNMLAVTHSLRLKIRA